MLDLSPFSQAPLWQAWITGLLSLSLSIIAIPCICVYQPIFEAYAAYLCPSKPQVPSNPRSYLGQLIHHGLDVFISTATQAQHEILAGSQRLGCLDCAPDRVGGLQRGNDAFQLAQQSEALQGLRISGRKERHPVGLLPVS